MDEYATPSGMSLRREPLQEREEDRLQREIDHFTYKLESERRQSMLLDERIKRSQQDLREQSGLYQSKSAASIPGQKMKHHMQTLERKLEIALSRQSSLASENRTTRELINRGRRQKVHSKNIVASYTDEIEQVKAKIENKAREGANSSRLDGMQRRQIESLRSKSLAEKGFHAAKIQEMQSFINKDKGNKSTQMRNIEKTINQNYQGPGEILDPSYVQSYLLNKWRVKLREEKKELDSYMKHVTVCDNAFKDISHATGISDIESIVTTFIKAEDQKQTLFNYISNLNTEIDLLEDSIQKIKESVQTCQQIEKEGKSAEIRIIDEQKGKIEQSLAKLDAKKDNLNMINSCLAGVRKPIESLLEEFKSSGLDVSKEPDNPEEIKDDTILEIVGELEQDINTLETYLAYQANERLAGVKAVPIETMENKEFGRKATLIQQLEAPDIEAQVENTKAPLPRARFNDLVEQALDARDARASQTASRTSKRVWNLRDSVNKSFT